MTACEMYMDTYDTMMTLLEFRREVGLPVAGETKPISMRVQADLLHEGKAEIIGSRLVITEAGIRAVEARARY